MKNKSTQDIMTPSTCAPNNRTSKYNKENPERVERRWTITFQILNTPLSAIDRNTRQKISKQGKKIPEVSRRNE